MKCENLDNSNFLLYAAKHYDNPQCFDTKEFYDDLKKFKYLKRLFNRYKETGDLKERLIINHLQVVYNLFGVEPATRMLFLSLKHHHGCLKPFLILFNTMPECIFNIEGTDIQNSDISMDNRIVEVLRKI
jgi:hypothetical protein